MSNPILAVIQRLCGIAAAGLLVACAANAQMSELSSTYIDSWSDDANLYGWGATAGSLPIHNYAVDVTITSPTGRSSTNTG